MFWSRNQTVEVESKDKRTLMLVRHSDQQYLNEDELKASMTDGESCIHWLSESENSDRFIAFAVYNDRLMRLGNPKNQTERAQQQNILNHFAAKLGFKMVKVDSPTE